MFKVLDLFSGIGGFSLGLERTGHFKTIAFCEIDNYCQRVLHKHWPGVYIHSDIRTLTAKHFDGWERPDCIVGGFPCQDISIAGKGAGLDGERSGLWREYARIIRELRPKYVIVENVSALLTRGLGRVLGDLAEIGYDAEGECIPASAIGAPHRRDRIWIVAYPSGGENDRRERRILDGTKRRGGCINPTSDACGEDVADPHDQGLERRKFEIVRECSGELSLRSSDPSLANSIFEQRNGRLYWTCGWEREPQEAVRDAWRGRGQEDGEPIAESLLGRVANGIPNRVDRLKSLGNSIVPQIATWIGNRIVEAEL